MSRSIQIVVILAILNSQVANILAADHIYTSNKGNKYYIENEEKYNWYEALTKCISMNMNLATIDSLEKSEEVINLLKRTFGNVKPLWIGGVANGSDRHFVWIANGKRATFTNWAPSQPDFRDNNEYCLQTGWSATVQWNDQKCNTPYGLICEDRQLSSRELDLQAEVNESLEKQKQLRAELGKNQLLLDLFYLKC